MVNSGFIKNSLKRLAMDALEG